MLPPPSRRWPAAAALLVAGALAPWMPAPAPAAASRPAAAAQTAPDPAGREIQALVEDLKRLELSMSARRQAALRLLERRVPAADAALLAQLTPESDPSTHQAVAQALVAVTATPPASFAEPLWRLMEAAEEPLLAELAAALARCRDGGVVRKVAARALDRTAGERPRRAAVLVLGQVHSQASAGTLIQLLAPEEPAALRHAACAALAQISGINDYNTDTARWQQWWASHGKLSQALWLDHLFANHARSQARLSAQLQQTQARLVQSQTRLYLATPKADQPALLTAMLDDGLPAMRLAALELCERRLSEQGAAGVGEELRKVLRLRIDDVSAALQERAVVLLKNLADEAAADRVAALLATDGARPANPAVLKAHLVMMARLPREAAMPRVLGLLEDASLRGEAAAVLTSAVDAGASLLSKAQVAQALASLRKSLAADEVPPAEVVSLLGRIGQDQDWERIQGWLPSKDPAVKTAAAGVWARSSRSLEPLAQLADDPVILPILLEAAGQRGQETKVWQRLAELRPPPELIGQTHKALIAMAGRCAPAQALKVEAAMADRQDPPSVRSQVVSGAINRLLPGVPPAATEPAAVPQAALLADLLLRRAQLRLQDQNPREALADHRRLIDLKLPLSPAQQRSQSLGLLEARLAADDHEGLLEAADAALAAAGGGTGEGALLWPMLDLFLRHSDQLLQGKNDPDRARQILRWVRKTAPTEAPGELLERLGKLELEAGLAPPTSPGAATQPTTAPATQPATQPRTQPATQPATQPGHRPGRTTATQPRP